MQTIEIRGIDEKPFIKDLEVNLESPDTNVKWLKNIIKMEESKTNVKPHRYRIFHKNCNIEEIKNQSLQKNSKKIYNECRNNKTPLNDIINQQPNNGNSKKYIFYFTWKLKNISRRYSYRGGKKTKKQNQTKKYRKQ